MLDGIQGFVVMPATKKAGRRRNPLMILEFDHDPVLRADRYLGRLFIN